MGTRILHLSEFVAERQRRGDAGLAFAIAPEGGFDTAIAFWRGATGQAYVHTVFAPADCPELPAANYLLVRRRADGRLVVLRIGCTVHTSSLLNLAELRRRAAQLGANEIHVHFLGQNSAGRDAIVRDLAQAHLADAATATVH